MAKRMPDVAREFFRHHGSQGGKIGSASLTAAARKARAVKAGQASAAARKQTKKKPG